MSAVVPTGDAVNAGDDGLDRAKYDRDINLLIAAIVSQSEGNLRPERVRELIDATHRFMAA